MLEDAVGVVAGDVFDRFGMVVEGGDDGEDGSSGFGYGDHVAEVDEVEGGLADAEDEAAALLEADVGGALDEVLGEAVGDAAEGAHGTGEDDHGVEGAGAGGDGGTDVVVGEEGGAARGVAEEVFDEGGARAGFGQAEGGGLFGEDAKGAGADDEVNAGNAGVLVEGAEHLDGEDGAAGAGDGEGDDVAGGGGHRGVGVGVGVGVERWFRIGDG